MAELDARAELRSHTFPFDSGFQLVGCKNGSAWRNVDHVGESPTLTKWGCSSVVEKTISFETLPRKSVD